MSKWFRWYEGTCEDGKFRCVARNAGVTVATVMGVWAALLEDASNNDHRGVAIRGEDFYAAILDLPAEELQHVLQAMDDMGVISVGHGAITISKWKERQFETDQIDSTNALRQRKYRERRNTTRNASNGGVTARNGSVTDGVTQQNKHESKNTNENNTHVTPLRNGGVSATKRPDTDTDTDTERKKDSDANASAAEAPVDHRKRLFDEGLPKLAKLTGKGPDACRSFVGKCLKEADDDAIIVLGLIEDAERNQAVDPSGWIAARLKGNRNGKAPSRVIQAADDLRRKIASFDGPPSGDFDLRDGAGAPPPRLLSHR